MPKVLSALTFTPNRNSRLLFDTNIWMSLFFTVGNYQHRNAAIYSKLYKEVLDCNATLFINSHIISEFINRFLKDSFNIAKAGPRVKYKNYRNSAQGKSDINELAIILNKKIFPNVAPINDSFSSINLNTISQQLYTADYNDLIVYHSAAKANAMIVTDDADFGSIATSSVLISGNTKLIKQNTN